MYRIYIHIPFCIRKCPYCDFYSVAKEPGLCSRFLTALKNEILSFDPVDADTIYFGGGTPSLLTPEEISDIITLLKMHNRITEDAEITMECNPATVTVNQLRGFRKAGVNRLSIGCQSFQPHLLSHLGRLHSAEEAKQTVSDAKAAGFDNISVDIMLGIPYATVETTEADAETALSLDVQHVSAYLLKICEGTPFADGVPGIPPDDVQADCYKVFCDTMKSGGMHQYEISNFAVPGYESRHNLKYWECGQWLGLGPAAHMSNGVFRASFPSSLRIFLDRFENSPSEDPIKYFKYEGHVDGDEYIIMGMRTDKGISRKLLKDRYDQVFTDEQETFIAQCVKHGLLEQGEDFIRFTENGCLLSNSILSELI